MDTRLSTKVLLNADLAIELNSALILSHLILLSGVAPKRSGFTINFRKRTFSASRRSPVIAITVIASAGSGISIAAGFKLSETNSGKTKTTTKIKAKPRLVAAWDQRGSRSVRKRNCPFRKVCPKAA
jgi:hypothetical protein